MRVCYIIWKWQVDAKKCAPRDCADIWDPTTITMVKGECNERYGGSQLEDCNVCRQFTTEKNCGRNAKTVKNKRVKKLFGFERQ